MSEDQGRDAGCSAVKPHLAAYASGGLDPAREQQVWGHLALCAPCRAMQAETVDPSVLFMELRGRPLPAPFWTGFMPRLRAQIDEREAKRFEWHTLLRYPRLAYLTAPVGMLLLLGITLFAIRPIGRSWLQSPGLSPSAQQTPIVQPASPPASAEADPFRIASRVSPGAETVTAPLLEEVGSPNARVYYFTVRDAGGETPIFLVVDESIDF